MNATLFVTLLCLFAICNAQNPVGNLELKKAFDAALIRMLADGTYDHVYTNATSSSPSFYYGDCAVASPANMDATYPWPTPTAGGVLANAISSGNIRVACPTTSAGQYSYNATSGAPYGVLFDIFRAVFDRIGTQYGTTISFTWVPFGVAFDINNALKNGTVDIAYGNLSPGSSYFVTSRNNIEFWTSCATSVSSNNLFYRSTSGSLYRDWAEFRTAVQNSAAKSMTIITLVSVVGTIAKANTNFPNANVETCPTVPECINQLLTNSTVSGLYGPYTVNDANVYSLTDPQIVPLAALIRRDPCPTVDPVTTENQDSSAFAVKYSVMLILAALIAFIAGN